MSRLHLAIGALKEINTVGANSLIKQWDSLATADDAFDWGKRAYLELKDAGRFDLIDRLRHRYNTRKVLS